MKEPIKTLEAVAECLPYGIKRAIEEIKNREEIEEIRLRADKPLCFTVRGESFFKEDITVRKEDIAYCVKRFCNESVYAHIKELNSGYIAGPCGSRIGVAGNFGGENAVHFSCLNIRIAHEIIGAADRLVKAYKGGGILILGPPACGKTTVLRDAVRQLSDGISGKSYRVSVIDSRGEITGGESGGMNIGKNTDVFLFCEKARGIEMALRTFSPEIICFDEIGTSKELCGVKQSINAGADIIATAHAGSLEDLKKRQILREFMLTGAVKTVVFMESRSLLNAEFIDSEELRRCRFY
ncbi:MAG: hypothetical protein KBS52_06780 [Clostridiales bacterium]|nr:hypothetical protein [Candidatus Equinaster intestinalis]